MTDIAPRKAARRKADDQAVAAVVRVAKSAHPVRPVAKKASVEAAHRKIAARYPKVLAELAK